MNKIIPIIGFTLLSYLNLNAQTNLSKKYNKPDNITSQKIASYNQGKEDVYFDLNEIINSNRYVEDLEKANFENLTQNKEDLEKLAIHIYENIIDKTYTPTQNLGDIFIKEEFGLIFARYSGADVLQSKQGDLFLPVSAINNNKGPLQNYIVVGETKDQVCNLCQDINKAISEYLTNKDLEKMDLDSNLVIDRLEFKTYTNK